MGRYLDSVCRVCRCEGLKLFLKGQRCYTEKCAFERREYIPGMHGQQRRSKLSEYGVQLREKQKVKKLYGLLERQFRYTFHKAERLKGITGENLLLLLESRLDNIVYRMGFAGSRAEARQFVRHGHIRVNDKKASIPSARVEVGDLISIQEKSRQIPRVLEALDAIDRRGIPTWLETDKKTFTGKVKALPSREELTLPMQEQLIVELYSK